MPSLGPRPRIALATTALRLPARGPVGHRERMGRDLVLGLLSVTKASAFSRVSRGVSYGVEVAVPLPAPPTATHAPSLCLSRSKIGKAVSSDFVCRETLPDERPPAQPSVASSADTVLSCPQIWAWTWTSGGHFHSQRFLEHLCLSGSHL